MSVSLSPDNSSYQTSLSESEQSDSKEDCLNELEDLKTLSEPAVTEMKLLSVMSPYEMEILTRLFPKCAETLAGVLCHR